MKKSFSIYFLVFISVACVDHLDKPLMKSDIVMMLPQSNKDIVKEIDRVTTMTPNELDEWEHSKGFISFRTVLTNAYKELEGIATVDQLELFNEKYSHILKLNGDLWVPTIDVSLYQAIVNEFGFYGTGNNLNRVIGDYIVSSHQDNYSYLKTLSIDEVEGMLKQGSIGDVKIFRFINESSRTNLRINTTCSTSLRASYFHNESNCRNDREVVVGGTSYIFQSTTFEGDWRQPKVEIKVYGLKRSATLCKWWSYKTSLSYRSVSYSLQAWAIVNNTAVPTTYSVVVPNETSPDDYVVLSSDKNVGSIVLNQYIEPYPFYTIHAEGTSRGVAGVWAVLDCQ